MTDSLTESLCQPLKIGSRTIPKRLVLAPLSFLGNIAFYIISCAASDLKKLKHYESENRKLKQMVAEQALDIRALKEVVSKNF